jgi:Secretion system C-terminal sorting domain
MNKFVLSASLLALIFSTSVTFAQDNRFQKEYGGSSDENSYAVEKTLDGGYITVGTTTSYGEGKKDVYLTKTNGMGQIEWSKAYGGKGDDIGWSVANSRDSGFVVAGTSNSYNSNNDDGLIFKTDKKGKVVWSKAFAADSVEDAYFVLNSFFSRGYYVTGFVRNDSTGDDGFIAKLGSAGNLRWYKKFGSPGDEEAYSITEDSKGNVLICGMTTYDSITQGGSSGSAGNSDAFLAKFDSTGNFKFMRTYGDTNNNIAWDVKTDKNVYLLTGWTRTTRGDDDIIIIKTDTSGALTAVDAYGTTGTDRAFEMHVGTGSTYSVAGYTDPTGTDRDALYLNIAGSGNLVNYTLLGGALKDGHWPTDLAPAGDGGFVILSTTASFRSGAGDDMFLVKTDDIGVVNCNSNLGILNTDRLTFKSVSFGSVTTGHRYQAPSLTTNTISSAHDSILCCSLVAEITQSTFDICEGTDVTLGKRGITGINYKWTDDQGKVVSNEANPKVTPKSTTTYKLVVSSNDKECASDSAFVKVNVVQRLVYDFARDTSFCEGDSVRFITRSNMASYQWIGTNFSSTSQAITIKKADTIYFTGFDANSCVYRDTMVSTTYALPRFNLGIDTTICENTPITMSGPANMKSYNWNNGASSSQNYTTATESKHTLVVVDTNGCTFTDSREISTNPFSTFSLGGDEEFCDGGAHTILGPGALGDYIWNDTASSFQNITVYEAGTYWLTAHNSFGCPYSDTIVLTTRDAPTFSLGADFNLCIGSSRYLFGPPNMKSYSWASGSNNDSLRITTSGTYVLTVKDSSDCSYTDTIIVQDVQNPIITLGNDTMICIGDSLLLAPGTFTTYSWSTGSTQPSIYVKQKGTYSVDVEDADGCVGSAAINVDTITCMSSVADLLLEDFKVYPIPVSKQLNIDFSAMKADWLKISIVNMTGKEVINENRDIRTGANHLAIDVQTLRPGAYFIRLNNSIGSSALKVWVE